jgi:putative transposase
VGQSRKGCNLQRNFHRLGLTTAAGAGSAPVFGRFEAEHPDNLWVRDALHSK